MRFVIPIWFHNWWRPRRFDEPLVFDAGSLTVRTSSVVLGR